MSDGGKGDKRRPTDSQKWESGYDRIWGNKKKTEETPVKQDDKNS